MSTSLSSLSRCLLGAAFAATLLTQAPRAQVVLSEINFTSNGQWIELHNAGTADADLTGWSIYHATSDSPGTHWFPMPASTIIKTGGYLRVHWLAELKPNTATDIYTGQSIYHFLFGLHAVPMNATRGALALYNTQINAQMNNPAAIQDWVSWGTTGFARESLAVAGGRWTQGSFAPAATGAPLPTLAYDYTSIDSASAATDWFLDSTPTPLGDNVGNASVDVIGTPCPQNARPGFQAALVANGVPASGNRVFSIRIDRQLNAGEFAVQFLALQPNPTPTPAETIFDCPIYFNLFTYFYSNPILPTQGVAEVNLGQFDIPGARFTAVWLVADPNRGWLTLTNGLDMQFGD